MFGYPGGAVLNIYDALYEYQDRIRHIRTAHEQKGRRMQPTDMHAPAANRCLHRDFGPRRNQSGDRDCHRLPWIVSRSWRLQEM